MNFLGNSFGSSFYADAYTLPAAPVKAAAPAPTPALRGTPSSSNVAAPAPSKAAAARPPTAAQLAKKITHSAERKAFELAINETESAWIDYEIVKTPSGASVLNLTHTDVPISHAGQGLGGALIKYAFEWAWDQRMKVRPTCPAITSWVLKNPDYQTQLEQTIPENF